MQKYVKSFSDDNFNILLRILILRILIEIARLSKISKSKSKIYNVPFYNKDVLVHCDLLRENFDIFFDFPIEDLLACKAISESICHNAIFKYFKVFFLAFFWTRLC